MTFRGAGDGPRGEAVPNPIQELGHGGLQLAVLRPTCETDLYIRDRGPPAAGEETRVLRQQILPVLSDLRPTVYGRAPF